MSNQTVQAVSTSNDKIKVGMAVFAVVAGIVVFYFLADQSTLIRTAALVAGLLLAIGSMWTSQPGRDFISFGKEAVRETKKVVWPSRKEAGMTTAVVFGFVLLMAIFLWVTDTTLEFLVYHVILGVSK